MLSAETTTSGWNFALFIWGPIIGSMIGGQLFSLGVIVSKSVFLLNWILALDLLSWFATSVPLFGKCAIKSSLHKGIVQKKNINFASELVPGFPSSIGKEYLIRSLRYASSSKASERLSVQKTSLIFQSNVRRIKLTFGILNSSPFKLIQQICQNLVNLFLVWTSFLSKRLLPNWDSNFEQISGTGY